MRLYRVCGGASRGPRWIALQISFLGRGLVRRRQISCGGLRLSSGGIVTSNRTSGRLPGLNEYPVRLRIIILVSVRPDGLGP